jgi:hypothetical protein
MRSAGIAQIGDAAAVLCGREALEQRRKSRSVVVVRRFSCFIAHNPERTSRPRNVRTHLSVRASIFTVTSSAQRRTHTT